jgi:capsular exopolysaccharide synthesis family protein
MTATNQEQPLHLFDYLRVIQVRWPIILLIFLLVLLTTGTITFLMPKQYDATALIQVQENANFEIFQSGGRMQGLDPRFTTTQFEIIKSSEILQPVMQRLGLVQKWGVQYEIKSPELIYRKLQQMMTLREVRNTNLISISVLSPDKNEAAEIANAVAKEYQEARIREAQTWATKSLGSLEFEVEKQRRKTDELRNAAAALRIEFGINDFNPESEEDTMQPKERVLLSVEEEVSAQRLRTSSLRARFEQLSRMTDDQIMRSIATLEVQDQTILQILPLYQEAASEEARMLSAGLGPKHPNVRAQRAKKETYAEQLKSQVTSLRAALATAVQIEEESLKSLEERLDESRTDQQESKSRAMSYYEAKNNYIQAKKVLEGAEVRFLTEMMQRSMPMNPAIIWDAAVPSDIAARPRVLLNMILGVFLGLVLGFGVAFFIEYLDTSVKTMEDIEKYFGLPVLAVVPRGVGLLYDLPEDSIETEPYRILRTNIEFNRSNPDAKVMTLVSGGPGEGKSHTLHNLALTFANSGSKTLVIDADLRRPRQHMLFDLPNTTGLTDYLSEKIPLNELILHSRHDMLDLMPTGRLSSGSKALLNSRRLTNLIEEAKSRYDIVLIDSPPILGVSDSSVIVRAVDLTAIVIQHRRFPRAMLLRVKDAVINAGGTLLGAILNNVDIRLDQYYQYQTNYYGYHDDGPDGAKPTPGQPKAANPPTTKPASAQGGRGDEY